MDPSPGEIDLNDLAEITARTEAVRSPDGFYSLAQRAVLLSHAAVGIAGGVAAVYALLRPAPEAIARAIDPRARLDFVPFAEKFNQAMHLSVGVEWPAKAAVSAAVDNLEERLRFAELIRLARGAEDQIKSFHARGLKPLSLKLAPLLSWERAHAKWIDTWQTISAVTALPPPRARDLWAQGGIE